MKLFVWDFGDEVLPLKKVKTGDFVMLTDYIANEDLRYYAFVISVSENVLVAVAVRNKTFDYYSDIPPELQLPKRIWPPRSF